MGRVALQVQRATCLLLLGLCAASAASAQQATVRGVVTDAETEQPLQGASVVLRGDAGRLSGAATDGDGYFALHRLPAGRYVLTISFVGYTAFQDTLTLAPGTVVQRQVALIPQEEELGEIVVRASEDASITTVSAGLETITPAQIDRVPMPGVTGDLATYLQTVPGVVTTGDRGGQFFVRGGAVDQNLAYLDGIPIYLPFHILNFYSAFPQEIIDHAAVYTGGYGARYGARVSSVMDVQTRKGNKQDLAGTFSIAPFLSTLQVEGPLLANRVSAIVSVRQSLLEAVMPDILGQRLPYRFGDRFGKVHAFLNARNSVSVTALQTFDRGDLAGTRTTFRGDNAPDVIDDSTEVAWHNRLIGGRYVYLSGVLPLLAEVSVGYSEMHNAIGPDDAAERESELQSLDAAAHVTLFLDESELRFGVTGRRSTLAYTLGGQFQDFASAKDEVTEMNGYVETDVALLDAALHVQPGLHLYALPERGQQWVEPRLRVQWQPTGAEGRLHLHAATGWYHQIIAGLNDERDIGNIFNAWFTTPEDDPVPSAVHGIAGATARITPWLSAASEVYFKRFTNLSVPIFSVFPQFTTALQPADGLARGLDVRLDVGERLLPHDVRIDGYVSYAYSTIEYEADQVTYHPPHDRRHQLNLLVHLERNRFGLTLNGQYGSGLPFTQSGGFDVWYPFTPGVNVANDPGEVRVLYGKPFAGRQPAYQRLDVWLERTVERDRTVVTMRAGAVNLFNRKNLFYFDLFTLKRVDQLPFVPSLGFKVELR